MTVSAALPVYDSHARLTVILEARNKVGTWLPPLPPRPPNQLHPPSSVLVHPLPALHDFPVSGLVGTDAFQSALFAE